MSILRGPFMTSSAGRDQDESDAPRREEIPKGLHLRFRREQRLSADAFASRGPPELRPGSPRREIRLQRSDRFEAGLADDEDEFGLLPFEHVDQLKFMLDRLRVGAAGSHRRRDDQAEKPQEQDTP